MGKRNPAALAMAKAKQIIQQDLIYVYGGLCIVLHEKGFSQDEILDIASKIQEFWNEQSKSQHEDNYESVPEKVSKLCGIDICQWFN